VKYIFIAGLEHSGSTLLNHLLCASPNAIGLGEVASYFSPAHMQWYMQKWGDYPDVRLCSCGHSWESCDIWGGLGHLNGLVNEEPLRNKYGELIEYFRGGAPEKELIVDSSKSPAALKVLVEESQQIGLRKEDLLVLVAVKDVRSFTASINAKEGGRASILSVSRTFNWWLGVNRSLLDYLGRHDVSFALVLYENLCHEPENIIFSILDGFGCRRQDHLNMQHANSHIAMGNKDFILRNRDAIRYDDRWTRSGKIRQVYRMHLGARRLNSRCYRESV